MNYTANDNLEIMKYAKNYNNFLIQEIVNIIKKYDFKNILDFGCADGFFIENISKIVDNVNLCGIEVDETSYKACCDKNITVFWDIDSIKNKKDLIYSLNVLEHIQEDVIMLKNFYNVLSDEGRLLLYVPALQFLYSSMDKKTGHFRRYEKLELTEKLKQARFKIEKMVYCDSLGVLATLMYILKDKLVSSNGHISKSSIILYDSVFVISRLMDKILFQNICGKNLLVVAKKE